MKKKKEVKQATTYQTKSKAVKLGGDFDTELIKEFASTWVLLDAYDKETLDINSKTKKSISLVAGELAGAIKNLRGELFKKSQATELFAQERKSGSVEGIVGNVMQSFGGQSLYPSLEEKAAHLLYFIVKNHPFADGNKRSRAFAFVWFLRRTGRLNIAQLTPSALTALTLLIAESHPKDKDKIATINRHKDKRIDAQYYMKVDKEEQVGKMLQEAKMFISMFDELVSNLNEEEINLNRARLKKAI